MLFLSFRPRRRTSHSAFRGSWVGVLVALATCAALLAACATPKSTGDDDASEAVQTEDGPGLDLAPTASDVKTVQLYRGSDERALPILSMRSSESLTLEFDVMARSGRPLSVYFEHADRQWRRDLSPVQFMESFQNDALLDYTPSRGTVVPYVHYTYQFPNDDIRFRISGNYIIRVTEQGRPDAVLFERAFFLTEEAGSLDLSAEGVVVTGQRRPSVRPIAQFSPPEALRGDPFGYNVCFVRNGRLDASRCVDRPRLASQPALSFEVDRRRAFSPVAAEYVLDLSTLRPGGDVERVDRSSDPYRVLLEPDNARFPGDPFDATLNGQTIVRDAVRDRVDPQVAAEYVNVTFAFVPPDPRPLNGEVAIAGSFTGMQYDADLRMAWQSDLERYEGDVLLKQGQYEYFYDSSDPRLREILRQNVERSQDVYTTFVYFEDLSQNTDRLLSVGSFRR